MKIFHTRGEMNRKVFGSPIKELKHFMELHNHTKAILNWIQTEHNVQNNFFIQDDDFQSIEFIPSRDTADNLFSIGQESKVSFCNARQSLENFFTAQRLDRIMSRCSEYQEVYMEIQNDNPTFFQQHRLIPFNFDDE
ncbi:Hypothetical_protein [Hexamita inflata]|uniref:Hypothetical_protein n=1 Tax=Hexamita inflata TaxID=28002 RepID=A0AA86Q5X1_9EUKA|nr:Hypothetical protein HINF_LOCUS37823 [Hexamita inflata]